MQKALKMYLLFLVLVVMNFRLILASPFGMGDRVLLFMGVAILMLICFSELPASHIKSSFVKFYYFCFSIYIGFYAVVIYSSPIKLQVFNFILERSFSPIVGSLLILFAYGRFSSTRLIWAFDKAVYLLLPCSAIIFIANNFFRKYSYDFYRGEDVIKYVFNFDGQLTNQRTLGMMINLENSAGALLMFYTYFTYKFIVSKILLRKKPETKAIAIFIIGTMGIFTTTSLSVILVAMSIVSALVLYAIFKIGFFRGRKSNSILALSLLVFFAFIKYFTINITDRFAHYFTNPNKHFLNIYLEQGHNWKDFFFNSRIAEMKSSGFGINEVHVLLSFSFLGLLPSFIWFVIFASVVYLSTFWRSYNSNERAVLIMMLSAFISSLHYAAVTAWPNNVFYFLCFVILVKRINKIKAIA